MEIEEEKVYEVVDELEKAKKSLYELYGDESIETTEIKHIDKAISLLKES